jgi:hypothetical protein
LHKRCQIELVHNARVQTQVHKSRAVQNFYGAHEQFGKLGVSHEGAVKSAFHRLLDHSARQHGWTLVPEWEIRRPRQSRVIVDGALLDNFRLTHGFWEAKDTHDNLEREVRKKFDLGYRLCR